MIHDEQIKTIATIQETVGKHFGVTRAQIISKSRLEAYTRPRHIAMYLSRKVAGAPFKTIGTLFWRDHSTVHNAIERMITRSWRDSRLKADIALLEKKVWEAVQ